MTPYSASLSCTTKYIHLIIHSPSHALSGFRMCVCGVCVCVCVCVCARVLRSVLHAWWKVFASHGREPLSYACVTNFPQTHMEHAWSPLVWEHHASHSMAGVCRSQAIKQDNVFAFICIPEENQAHCMKGILPFPTCIDFNYTLTCNYTSFPGIAWYSIGCIFSYCCLRNS